MTYGEWEPLRCEQANQEIQNRLRSLPFSEDQREARAALFQHFTDGMAIKYQGDRSWRAIYDELLEDLEKTLEK